MGRGSPWGPLGLPHSHHKGVSRSSLLTMSCLPSVFCCSWSTRRGLAASRLARGSECGPSLPRLLPYPLGLLRLPLIADGFDRAILQEPVLVNPTALVGGSDDVPDHLDASVFLLEGGPTLGCGGAHGGEDTREARLASYQ